MQKLVLNMAGASVQHANLMYVEVMHVERQGIGQVQVLEGVPVSPEFKHNSSTGLLEFDPDTDLSAGMPFDVYEKILVLYK